MEAGMGLMDRVKAQATVLAQKTQETAREGMARLDQATAARHADTMLRNLGALVYAEQTGRGAPDAQDQIARLVSEISAHEAENGINLATEPAGWSAGVAGQPGSAPVPYGDTGQPAPAAPAPFGGTGQEAPGQEAPGQGASGWPGAAGQGAAGQGAQGWPGAAGQEAAGQGAQGWPGAAGQEAAGQGAAGWPGAPEQPGQAPYGAPGQSQAGPPPAPGQGFGGSAPTGATYTQPEYTFPQPPADEDPEPGR
jgi:hypothetical protein